MVVLLFSQQMIGWICVFYFAKCHMFGVKFRTNDYLLHRCTYSWSLQVDKRTNDKHFRECFTEWFPVIYLVPQPQTLLYTDCIQ